MRSAEVTARGVACARAALAGNPSDGYGGAVLAAVVPEFQAEATVARAPVARAQPPSELVEATAARFARELEAEATATAVRWHTTIPRCVGLGGSSAIVIATVRALCRLYSVPLERDQLAAFALAVEVEELGIAAGLQDRVAQSYGGLTFMEFADGGAYEQLEPELLPPLVVGWRVDAAQESGVVHGDLRARFERAEPAVLAGMRSLAECARGAREALIAGDRDALARCADRSFDARRDLLALDPRHVAMIECARRCGAGANYAGSGGAIVAVCRDESHRGEVIRALRATGCGASLTTPQ